jgi:plasmid replication initiation protein
MSKTNIKLVVCETHEIIDSTYFLELSELRILQLCLAKVFLKAGVQEDVWYPVDKKLYADTYNVSEETAYEALLQAAKQLMSRSIILKSSLLDETISEKSKSKTVIGWLSNIRYNHDTRQLELKWSDGLVKILNKLGLEYPYSKYYLDHTSGLKSLHAMRLYRLLNRYTYCHYATIELAEFLKLMGIGVDKDESVYGEFKYLNKYILKPAIENINSNTNLIVSVSTIKLARRVHKLHFKINKKINYMLD